MSAPSDRSAQHPLASAEVACLVGLLFFLPLLEAPKNLLWLSFVLFWLGRAFFSEAGWSGPWRTSIDLPFAAILFVAVLSCALAAPFPQRWNEVGDVLRYTLLGWLVARSRLNDRQLFAVLAALLAGTLLAAAFGWWQWRVTGDKALFELHSVGHTNHSAIYLVMVGLGTLGAVLVLWNRLSSGWRIGLSMAWFFQTWLIATGESRGALLAYGLGMAVLIPAMAPEKWRNKLLLLIAVLLATTLAWNSYLIEKTLNQLHDPAATTKTSMRIELARTAYTAFRERPLTGIGPGNFGLLTEERVAAWLAARNEAYDPARHFHSGHAHGLYSNTLAERGLLGIAALLFLAWTWFRTLQPRSGQPPDDMERTAFVRAVGLAGFIGVFVAGIFNTSLHHEHGLLAMFSLGLLLGNGTEGQSPQRYMPDPSTRGIS